MLIIFFCSFALVRFHMVRIRIDELKSHLQNENLGLEELLIGIMYTTLRPFKCVAIICDEIYYEYFQGAFFKSIKAHVTFFIVNEIKHFFFFFFFSLIVFCVC